MCYGTAVAKLIHAGKHFMSIYVPPIRPFQALGLMYILPNYPFVFASWTCVRSIAGIEALHVVCS